MDNTTPLTEEHRQYLSDHAVDLDLALSLGVRSLSKRSDTSGLPEPWNNFVNLPAILFPWRNSEGRTEYQVRPDDPTADQRGRTRKYLFRKDMEPVMWELRPAGDTSRVLIVEGTKQSLAAASYAAGDVGIYGIAGCRMWQRDGMPIPGLDVVTGHDVVIILDADAAENLAVYEAGIGLAEALAMEGARSVRFGRLPAGGKSGLDDVLASRKPDKRASYLASIISGAKPKPADTRPKRKQKSAERPTDHDRVTIVCNRDRLEVINDLTNAMVNRWDGSELFNHGGVISWLRGRSMHPIDRGTSRDLLQLTAITVNEIEDRQGIRYTFDWPDANSISAVMSRADRFAPLERIAHAPFVRPDGSIVTTPGYDRETRTMLLLDPSLEGIEVPDHPDQGQIDDARDLVMDEWLGDFPFAADPDRANVLALAVTPVIRGLVLRVPLAVVDGLQMGVGKNLLADVILTVHTGEPARPMNFVDEHEELRKQITSAFRTGTEFFVFDEAHTIEGAALAQALTASTWQDRILGVSTMAEFPNRVTWISLGNNVQVRGDLTRRVYRIALRPDYANPQDRPAESFRHPGQSGLDLGSWTREHRRELLIAIHTIVRAWFDRGRPCPKRGVSFGSFETWERIAGGIVEIAGLSGFLGDLRVWRSESDFDSQYWTNHLRWLLDTFGDRPFRTAEVRAAALSDPADYLAPPRLDDPSDKGYSKSLGEAYARLRGRRYEGMYLDRLGNVRGHVSLWEVHDQPAPPDRPDDQPAPSDRPDDQPAPPDGPDDREQEQDRGEETMIEEIRDDDGRFVEYRATEPRSGVVALDLETGDAGDLYRHGPGYVRLTGAAHDDQPVTVANTATGAVKLASEAVRSARVLTGHNIVAFDLPALVREGALTMPEIHQMAVGGQLFDALLVARHIDPPMARDKGIDATRKYDLGTLAGKYRLGVDKLTDVSGQLAAKYGGWGAIPTDTGDVDPERARDAEAFHEYLVHDVELSRRLRAALLEKLGGTMPDYLVREHRVAALATQISLNGFRVDVPELERRITEIEHQKDRAMGVLATRYGIPTTSARGEPYKSPLGTKAGKVALTAALTAAGATSIWTTEKTGLIDISSDHMRHLASEYHHLKDVRVIARMVYEIVSARTVYETIANHLVGNRVHPRVSFKQATGRWSLTQPGLTVMGKRGGRHVERMVFLPEPGEMILTVDLSQVDMRAVAGLSQDRAYIEMLRHDDPHTEIAVALFGDSKRRSDAKAIGHGWNYGRGIRAISEGQDIDPALVRQFDASMRERFGRLVEWQGEVRTLAESGALLDNGFGRPMRPDPRRAHTQGPALMGQGAARDIMMTGLLRLADAHPETLPMLRAQVHDEIVMSVPRDQAEDVARAVVDALTFEWRGVPITADAGPLGETWGHCYIKE